MLIVNIPKHWISNLSNYYLRPSSDLKVSIMSFFILFFNYITIQNKLPSLNTTIYLLAKHFIPLYNEYVKIMLWGILASLILVFFIYLTAKIWIWIYKNAFWIQNYKKIIFVSLFTWGIAAGSILLFPKICSYFWLETFTNYYFWRKTVWLFAIYLNTLLVLFSLIFWKFSKQQFLNLIVFNIYFLLQFTIFSKLWAQKMF